MVHKRLSLKIQLTQYIKLQYKDLFYKSYLHSLIQPLRFIHLLSSYLMVSIKMRINFKLMLNNLALDKLFLIIR